MGADAEQVLKVIDEFDGVLPFNDKARPETILREFNMSKNAFKRAVGRLLKEGKIEITEKTIRRTDVVFTGYQDQTITGWRSQGSSKRAALFYRKSGQKEAWL